MVLEIKIIIVKLWGDLYYVNIKVPPVVIKIKPIEYWLLIGDKG